MYQLLGHLVQYKKHIVKELLCYKVEFLMFHIRSVNVNELF